MPVSIKVCIIILVIHLDKLVANVNFSFFQFLDCTKAFLNQNTSRKYVYISVEPIYCDPILRTTGLGRYTPLMTVASS